MSGSESFTRSLAHLTQADAARCFCVPTTSEWKSSNEFDHSRYGLSVPTPLNVPITQSGFTEWQSTLHRSRHLQKKLGGGETSKATTKVTQQEQQKTVSYKNSITLHAKEEYQRQCHLSVRLQNDHKIHVKVKLV